MKTIKVTTVAEVEVSDTIYGILKAGNYPLNNYYIGLREENSRLGIEFKNNKTMTLGEFDYQEIIDIKL